MTICVALILLACLPGLINSLKRFAYTPLSIKEQLSLIKKYKPNLLFIKSYSKVSIKINFSLKHNGPTYGKGLSLLLS